MKTRLFRKPSYDSKSIQELTEGISKLHEGLEVPKFDHKDYLKKLNELIYDLTKKWEQEQKEYAEKSKALASQTLKEEEKHLENVRLKVEEINVLETKLIAKRKEWLELRKPLIERERVLDEKATVLIEREKTLVLREQSAFESERAVENKLEAIQDLSDEIGDKSVKLIVRENALNAKNKVLDEREMLYLVKVEKFEGEVRTRREELQAHSLELELRELNVQGQIDTIFLKEEELAKREVALKDKYETLLRTEKRLHG